MANREKYSMIYINYMIDFISLSASAESTRFFKNWSDLLSHMVMLDWSFLPENYPNW